MARTSAPHVQCLLGDFGDTLCDERSLWRVSAEWMDVYRSFDDDDRIGAAWSLGDLGTDEVVARLARRMTKSEAEIRAHLFRTDLFRFFPFTFAFFQARYLPQAIVTVNPDVFRDLAEKLGLASRVETVVVSAEEKSVDKGVLCELAIRRMATPCDHGRALLIDDKQSSLDAWAGRGGIGYLYTTDEAFQRDVAGGIDGLAQR